MSKLEVYQMRRKARVQLTADQGCRKCDGRGVRIFTEYEYFQGKITARVKMCECVEAEFFGKPPRLPKLSTEVEVVGSVKTA